ncbi:MAG: hypothetical protein K9N40_05980 [Candidatus Cloacimonetes bacterium]|nr:hypothetical protein [Candidatus Cloacimonadota bacterium]
MITMISFSRTRQSSTLIASGKTCGSQTRISTILKGLKKVQIFTGNLIPFRND